MGAPSALALPKFETQSPPAFREFQAVPESTIPKPSRWGFCELFAVAQVAGPALLYLPGSQPFRVPLRVGVFALSLVGLVWCFRKSRVTKVHPSWTLLLIAAAYMAAMIVHPATNTTMAGLAQIGMHIAITAPLFWAPDYFRGDYRRLLRVLTILWVLNCASVVVGILQVRDPGTWMPSEFTTVMKSYRQNITYYQYRAADGSMVIRPPGLGDAPGAACGAGMFVAIVGLVYMGLPVSLLRKMLGVVMGMAGITVIFLSHVRSSLVVVVGCAVIYSIVMLMQGRSRTVLNLVFWAALCGSCGFLYAEVYGGKSISDRFGTLLKHDPWTVYEKSARMGMVTDAFDSLLADYPIGAGLGRWGMMRMYFGNENNPDSPQIWVEVQFQAWVLDGGIVLLSLYLIAIGISLQRLFRICFGHQSSHLRQWGAAIMMLSAGPVALTFSYCPFNSQLGLQFWLLIGAMEGLAQAEEEQYLAADRGTADIISHPESVHENGVAFNHV